MKHLTDFLSWIVVLVLIIAIFGSAEGIGGWFGRFVHSFHSAL